MNLTATFVPDAGKKSKIAKIQSGSREEIPKSRSLGLILRQSCPTDPEPSVGFENLWSL
jgi:hypothetical protein